MIPPPGFDQTCSHHWKQPLLALDTKLISGKQEEINVTESILNITVYERMIFWITVGASFHLFVLNCNLVIKVMKSVILQLFVSNYRTLYSMYEKNLIQWLHPWWHRLAKEWRRRTSSRNTGLNLNLNLNLNLTFLYHHQMKMFPDEVGYHDVFRPAQPLHSRKIYTRSASSAPGPTIQFLLLACLCAFFV